MSSIGFFGRHAKRHFLSGWPLRGKEWRCALWKMPVRRPALPVFLISPAVWAARCSLPEPAEFIGAIAGLSHYWCRPMRFPVRTFVLSLAVWCLPASLPAGRTEAAGQAAGVVIGMPEKIHAPTDLAALRRQLHRRVVVEGVVAATGQSRTGATSYLNFTKNYRESVSLVFFGGRKNEFPQEKLAEFVGKKIHVGGLLDERSGALQVRVFELEQIKVLK